MTNEKSTICVKCKKLVPLSKIRADINGKDWVCINCYQMQDKKSLVRLRISKLEDPLAKSKLELEGQIKPKKGEKITVKCDKCSYSFLIAYDAIPKKCPYCANEETLRQTITAKSILKEIEEEDGFYRK